MKCVGALNLLIKYSVDFELGATLQHVTNVRMFMHYKLDVNGLHLPGEKHVFTPFLIQI